MSKILIINNNPDHLQSITEIITRMGLQVQVSEDAVLTMGEATELFDLVLLDANLPGQNGSHVLHQIKTSEYYKRVGVIVMTDDQSDEYLAGLLEMGAHDFITQPINAVELEARVKSVLEQQNALKKIDQQNALLELKMEELQLQKEVLTEQKTSIAQANTDITESIEYAKRIQESMLPSNKEIDNAFPESFVLFEPRHIISGDFYWFAKKQLSDYYHKLILAVVDCTGHGVPGAFMSMIGDALLNHAVHDLEIHEPDQILVEMDKGLWTKLNQERSENSDGMELSVCMIDKKEKTLRFAGAGQHLVYFQNNELFFIKGDTGSIGGGKRNQFIEKEFKVHTIDLSTPTWVYMFTDGYQSQFGGTEYKKLKGNRFRQLLQKIHQYPSDKQLEALKEQLENWVASNVTLHNNDTKLIDDVLVWGFKVEL